MSSYGLVFYLLIILIGKISAEICDERFNPTTCVIEINCNGPFGLRYNSLSYYSTYHYNQNIIRRVPGEIEHCVNIIYQGNEYHPIKLIYNDLRTYSDELSIPYQGNNNYEETNLITYFDLRNNNYTVMPIIKEMQNLVTLDLSNNSIAIAKLTNKYILDKLTEIDLSHNKISYIQNEEDGEHQFINLKKIDLSYNNLDKIPDVVFGPFKQLETLDLSHNYINTLKQLTFEGTMQLISLNLSSNEITDINSSLFRFVRLQQLDLSFNKITSIKLSDFNKLVNLEILDLSNNFIANVEKDTFSHMNALNTLYLNNNELPNLDKDTFNNVSNLNSIDLSRNIFKILPKGLFKNKEIRIFSIEYNRLEGSIVRSTFEGLVYINTLDLSYQFLDSIEDDAFFGLNEIEIILLNNNKIRVLSPKSFRMTQTLKTLDLSFNQIDNIDFEKVDLYNLLSLSLRSNNLTTVKHENFHGLNALQFLDLSDNKITKIETNSFQSLKELINFQISNNPLSGTLEENTFDGLNSLPSLDISCSLLTSVQNSSFSGMVQLKKLNISHGNINLLEHDVFIQTGAIRTIDLSYNRLEGFSINSSELVSLDELYLNNNLIKTLDFDTFKLLSSLTVLTLAHNLVEKTGDHIFKYQKSLRKLDLSYNPVKLDISFIRDTTILETLDLSGLKTTISFDTIEEVSVTKLSISNSSIVDVKLLHLNGLHRLDRLVLSNNDIYKLDNDGFANIKTLRFLDVSHNRITHIQPGVFKDNNLLYSLNISHNMLTDISYGIFHGLIYLNTLDISYNNVRDLDNERFFEASSLSVLIADHNKIESISAEEFLGTSLTYLSIGDNPIPCELLVKLNRSGVPFHITARRLDYTYNENVHGMTCKNKSYSPDFTTNINFPTIGNDSTKVLINIRDILFNHFHRETTSTDKKDEKYILANITDSIVKSNANLENKITQVMNSTIQAIPKGEETNVLLQKILKVLTLTSSKKSPSIEIAKGNATYDNLVSYINKVKQDLEESLNYEKDYILKEMDTKISAFDSKFRTEVITEAPKHEKQIVEPIESKSLFTETCVGLILIILVCLVLYNIFKSGLFARNSFSVSTRELPGAMDSSL